MFWVLVGVCLAMRLKWKVCSYFFVFVNVSLSKRLHLA